MNKIWTDYTKKELLSLPVRKGDGAKDYNSLLLVNTKRKHESGYNLFAVIGCEDGSTPTEIVGYMDDFHCNECLIDFRFDCSMRGVFRLHSLNYRRNKFRVGATASTTDFGIGVEIERE